MHLSNVHDKDSDEPCRCQMCRGVALHLIMTAAYSAITKRAADSKDAGKIAKVLDRLNGELVAFDRN
jgi:hypothetical protein